MIIKAQNGRKTLMSFESNKINVQKHDPKYLRNYASKTHKCRKMICKKRQIQNAITIILKKWYNRKLELEAKTQQDAATRHAASP